ncbi:hypothetical protein DL96DRAFT_597597 [Flagelloscypha sp. PMI_526]|nr:hypothetical protein DL96DRAFT_597597 [Flagelloscypha sp. PMI_526]
MDDRHRPSRAHQSLSGSSRCSRSQPRSESEQVVSSPHANAPLVPITRMRLGSPPKPATVPKVIPPGQPPGSTWVIDSTGWPRLVPGQHQTGFGTEYPVVPLVEPQDDSRASTPLSHIHPLPHTAAFLGESNRSSRSETTRNQDSRRSRSHSRSREDEAPLPLDLDVPPVPPVPPHPNRGQKPYRVPEVIPPGYPEGTRWVVGRDGRPRLETPEQYRKRYGVRAPAVAPNRHAPLQAVAHHPQPVAQPQYEFVHPTRPESVHPPDGVEQMPQKPFLKRIFGGFGGKQGSKTSEHTHPPPAAAPASPSAPRTERRPRTKSMC